MTSNKPFYSEADLASMYKEFGIDPNNPTPAPAQPTSSGMSVGDVSDKGVVLENLSCVDANGTIFERHDRLFVPSDIFRTDNGKQKNGTPYQHIAYAETRQMFIPCFALSCNIAAHCFKNKHIPELEAILMQYKHHGAGYGWQAQNTVLDWKSKRIIHYPSDSDFPEYGGAENINANANKKVIPFTISDFGDVLVEEALNRPEFEKYIKNLTGLHDPSVLVDIGKLFGKEAKVWVPDNPQNATYTAAAWLGCYRYDFGLNADYVLNGSGAARGVRSIRP